MNGWSELAFRLFYSELMNKNPGNGVPQAEQRMNLNPYVTDAQAQMQTNQVQQQDRKKEMGEIIAHQMINNVNSQQQYGANNVPYGISNQNQGFNQQPVNSAQNLVVNYNLNPNSHQFATGINQASINTGSPCPNCNINAPTTTRRESGRTTYKWCIILSFVACCIVPFCLNQCLDLHEICTHCGFHRAIIPASFQCL